MRRLLPFLPAIVLLFGVASILKTRAQSATRLAAPLQSIQPPYGTYASVDQVFAKDEVAVAGMTDYVAKVYTAGGVAAFTTLVSYYDRQLQGRTIHSPRNCLPGSGWEVLSPGTRELHVGAKAHVVNRYLLKNGSHVAMVLYWYQGRGRVVANEYDVKWNLLVDAAMLGRTEEALVRIVVPVQATGERSALSDSAAVRSADSLGVDVAAKLITAVDKVLPKR